MKIFFGILATVVAIGSGHIPYLRDMFKGETKPHAYTWLIWIITLGTAVAGLWKGNGGWGILSLSVELIFVFIIFLLSFKYGTKNITKTDTLILIVALAAVLVWWQLDNPVLAVAMAAAIDVIGYIPSWRKSYFEPWSETIFSWVGFTIANFLGIISLAEYNSLTLTYLLSVSVANIILIAICLVRRRVIKRV